MGFHSSLSNRLAAASKKIKSHQLLSSLKKTSSAQIQTLKKQLAKVNKHQAVLQQPLPKPQAEKVDRSFEIKENVPHFLSFRPNESLRINKKRKH